MSRHLQLEDFADPTTGAEDAKQATQAPHPSPEPSEQDGLDVYEAGYKSGWDDCAAAEAENQRRIGADLASNLQDMRFTYADARRDVLEALAPLFEEMASQLLPAFAAEAVAPVVIGELQVIAQEASIGDAILTASPAAAPVLQRLIDAQDDLEIRLQVEPAFADGQVSIRYGNERRDIDLGEATARMSEAIRAFVGDARDGENRTHFEGAA